MKTPISVINLMLESSEDSQYIEKRLKEDIKGEVDKLYEDLDKALSIMRLEEFSRDYAPEEVDIIDSLKNIINSKKNSFIYNNVYPEITCNLSEVKVLTDKKWNEFMLGQIVSNAIKYSSAESCTVDDDGKIVKFIIDKIEDKIILTIKDQGLGIPEYDLKRIFQPFFTGENGRRVKGSSGIGLYIVGLISEKLNHKIEIISNINEGTSVKITYLSKM